MILYCQGNITPPSDGDRGKFMKKIGIVTEYNPFHNGHLFQIESLRKREPGCAVIAAMSSNFVQRGEPSLFSKFRRAEAAVRCGVDLVLEIPVFFSCQSAGQFAGGGINVLAATNCIDAVSFGMEDASSLDSLQKMCRSYLDNKTSVDQKIGNLLKEGHSWPKARETVFSCLAPAADSKMFSRPNQILAFEYLKVMEEKKYGFEVIPVQRIGEYHDTVPSSGKIASATAIRKMISEKQGNGWQKYLPEKAAEVFLSAGSPVTISDFSSVIIYLLRVCTAEEIASFHDNDIQLSLRLKEMAGKTDDAEELIRLVKNRSITYTRISRALVNILLQRKTSAYETEPEYIRVLAFNEKGRDILREMKTALSLPLVNKFADFDSAEKNAPAEYMLELEKKATAVYSLASGENPKNDFLKSPVFIKKEDL